jgi:Fe-S cluster assembly iron-binding protein IscA
MLTVTSSAKDILKEDLQRQRDDEETLIRIARSSSDPQQVGLLLDKEKEGDHVIADNEGDKLLLIGQDMGNILTEKTLDYKDTDQGMRLTLTGP